MKKISFHILHDELSKLRIHMEKGGLLDIPPPADLIALHKTLRKNISRQRLGIH